MQRLFLAEHFALWPVLKFWTAVFVCLRMDLEFYAFKKCFKILKNALSLWTNLTSMIRLWGCHLSKQIKACQEGVWIIFQPSHQYWGKITIGIEILTHRTTFRLPGKAWSSLCALFIYFFSCVRLCFHKLAYHKLVRITCNPQGLFKAMKNRNAKQARRLVWCSMHF